MAAAISAPVEKRTLPLVDTCHSCGDWQPAANMANPDAAVSSTTAQSFSVNGR
jgi:hypothetical protein